MQLEQVSTSITILIAALLVLLSFTCVVGLFYSRRILNKFKRATRPQFVHEITAIPRQLCPSLQNHKPHSWGTDGGLWCPGWRNGAVIDRSTFDPLVRKANTK